MKLSRFVIPVRGNKDYRKCQPAVVNGFKFPEIPPELE